jgi:hypothetical protein
VDASLQQQNWACWCGPDPAKDAQQLVVELEQFLFCEHAHPEHHRRYAIASKRINVVMRVSAAAGETDSEHVRDSRQAADEDRLRPLPSGALVRVHGHLQVQRAPSQPLSARGAHQQGKNLPSPPSSMSSRPGNSLTPAMVQ